MYTHSYFIYMKSRKGWPVCIYWVCEEKKTLEIEGDKSCESFVMNGADFNLLELL